MYDAVTADDRAAALDGAKRVADLALLEMARIVGAVLASDDHRLDGCGSAAEWVCERLAVSRIQANELVRMAERLPALPHVDAALESGRLSWEQAVRVATIVDHVGDEAHWTTVAEGCGVARLDAMARQAQRITRERADAVAGDARVAFRTVDTASGPMRRISGLLPADQAEKIEVALERIASERGLARDAESGVWNSRGRQLADALVQLASTRLGADRDRDRATVVIHAEASVVDGGDGWARLADGTPLAPETVRRYCCDGRLQLLVAAADGTPLAAAQVTQAISASMERVVRFRDLDRCRFPRCSRQANHIHHIVWRSRGGLTVAGNLVSLCARHHHRVHEGGWHMGGSADALVVSKPDGTVFSGAPPELPPTIRERIAGVLRLPLPNLAPALAR